MSMSEMVFIKANCMVFLIIILMLGITAVDSGASLP